MDDNRRAFTLTELLIVMAILVIMVAVLVGIINPVAMIGKAKDARRKKDLNRIKVAFEEYFNDKDCYPTEAVLATLRLKSNCGSKTVFSPWLATWPCDPNGEPYYVFTDGTSCPRWFKLIVNLENESDGDIPEGWYERTSSFLVGDGTVQSDQVNYGTSSTNVFWYDRVMPVGCGGVGTGCFYRTSGGNCNSSGVSCVGSSCYLQYRDPVGGGIANCSELCRVDCCNSGIVCEQ